MTKHRPFIGIACDLGEQANRLRALAESADRLGQQDGIPASENYWNLRSATNRSHATELDNFSIETATGVTRERLDEIEGRLSEMQDYYRREHPGFAIPGRRKNT